MSSKSKLRSYCLIKACELFISQVSEEEKSRSQAKRLRKAFDEGLKRYGEANCNAAYPVAIQALEYVQNRINEYGSANYGLYTVYNILTHYVDELAEFMGIKPYDLEALRNDLVRGSYKTAIIKMDIQGKHGGIEGSKMLAKGIKENINKAIYEMKESA